MTGRELLGQALRVPSQYVVLIGHGNSRLYATGIDSRIGEAKYRFMGQRTRVSFQKLKISGVFTARDSMFRVSGLVSSLEGLANFPVEIFVGHDCHVDLFRTDSAAGVFWLRSRL